MEPTRLELNFPTAIVDSSANNIVLPNQRDMQSWIASSFSAGDVLTIHIIVESTGSTRRICKWTDPTRESKYQYPCNHVSDEYGVCPLSEDHSKKEAEALQPLLELTN